MDLEFILFKAFPALKFIFKIDYIPCREDFKELTMEQYERYYKSEAFKIFLILSQIKWLL